MTNRSLSGWTSISCCMKILYLRSAYSMNFDVFSPSNTFDTNCVACFLHIRLVRIISEVHISWKPFIFHHMMNYRAEDVVICPSNFWNDIDILLRIVTNVNYPTKLSHSIQWYVSCNRTFKLNPIPVWFSIPIHPTNPCATIDIFIIFINFEITHPYSIDFTSSESG